MQIGVLVFVVVATAEIQQLRKVNSLEKACLAIMVSQASVGRIENRASVMGIYFALLA